MNKDQYDDAVIQQICGCLMEIAQTLEVLRLESAQSHVEKRKIQKLVAKIEQIECNDIDLVKLYTQIQGVSTTDLTQLSNRLDQLIQQVAIIPTGSSTPNLSNLATKQEVANLAQLIKDQEKNTIVLVAIVATAMALFIGFGLNATRSNLTQEVQIMQKNLPMQIEMYRQQEGDNLRTKLKKNRQERKG